MHACQLTAPPPLNQAITCFALSLALLCPWSWQQYMWTKVIDHRYMEIEDEGRT